MNYSYAFNKMHDNQHYNLTIIPVTEFVNKKLEVKFKNRHLIVDVWNSELNTTSQTLQLEDYLIPSETEEILIDTTEVTATIFTWSLVLFYVIKLVLKKSLRTLWDTIDAI
jgi:hypothetical protein